MADAVVIESDLTVSADDEFYLSAESWARVQSYWWVWDKPWAGKPGFLEDFDWLRWTWSPVEPPLTVGHRSNGCGWRHPRYDEAVYRQQVFLLDRAWWNQVMSR